MGQLSKAADSPHTAKPGRKLSKQTRLNLNPKAQPFVPAHTFMNEQTDLLMAAAHLDLLTQTLMNEQVGMLLNTFQWQQPLEMLDANWQQQQQQPCDIPEPPGLERRSWASAGQSHDGAAQQGKRRSDTGSNQGAKFKYAQREGAKNADQKNTMKAQLEALRHEDPAKVFIARGINKLGFSSAEILRAFFSRFGEVKGIHVSHSRVKSMRAAAGEPRPADTHWRLRAGPLGFIVMNDAEVTARILAEGPEQDVNGVKVRVQAFQGQPTEAAEGSQEKAESSEANEEKSE
mmetsp:Transcript_62101/g.108690  ORF Transcript_62101/g.108690 Transcript_62101/m.108690 type:complete len:289 (-) Transcript_62101:303-1169(-)